MVHIGSNGFMKVWRVPALTIALGALCIAELGAQTGARDMPPGLRSLAGVTLNRDSAASIRATLGATRERHVGAGHDAYIVWCYTLPHESPRALLELMSDASEMGTPGRALNVIRLRVDAPARDREGCTPLPASAELATPAGLRLGLVPARIRQLLGAPASVHADSLVYEFSAKEFLRPGTPAYEHWNTMEYRESCFDAGPPYANVRGTAIVLLRHARAEEIRLERYDQSVC